MTDEELEITAQMYSSVTWMELKSNKVSKDLQEKFVSVINELTRHLKVLAFGLIKKTIQRIDQEFNLKITKEEQIHCEILLLVEELEKFNQRRPRKMIEEMFGWASNILMLKPIDLLVDSDAIKVRSLRRKLHNESPEIF